MADLFLSSFHVLKAGIIMNVHIIDHMEPMKIKDSHPYETKLHKHCETDQELQNAFLKLRVHVKA